MVRAEGWLIGSVSELLIGYLVLLFVFLGRLLVLLRFLVLFL
jgi:hypothetical protein